MLRRAISRGLIAAQVAVWHGMLLSAAALHLRGVLFFLGVGMLMRIPRARVDKDPIVLMCRFYGGLSGCLCGVVGLLGTVAIGLMFVVGSVANDADVIRTSLKLFVILIYVMVAVGFIEALADRIRETIEGPYMPTVPGREAKEIPRHAAYNVAEMEAAERGRRTRGVGR
ncbi:hypothetical protein [Paludisphaera mucosa]|uniref:Uncharacterized protein n=1 Tax=Paludisphaera mucosa TaxID=3030827 RepID=A0ABT6FLL1_9BACT|nr:hypothetical protein [Paludisphaera mucosa]MDG3008463.1 hypothetical protein [Paludisphaera mucosa]